MYYSFQLFTGRELIHVLLRHFRFALLVLLCLALSPASLAQLPSPTPDGAYPNGNTAEGDGALFSLTTGSENTAIGFDALTFNTSGTDNTAVGAQALANNTIGKANTATGNSALLSNKIGNANTATGNFALLYNTTGIRNTATGVAALASNTTGPFNTATGSNTLSSNQQGSANTATGYGALISNNADDNTATGTNALLNNTTGIYNTATGAFALENSSVGKYNTADGLNALVQNSSGDANTAIGVSALFSNDTGSKNTAAGILALEKNTTGDSNIAFGFNAGSNLTTGSNNIDIGNVGNAGESNHIRIGTEGTQTNTFIAGIRGTTTAGGNAVPVVIDSAGQLGTVSSSQRFKDDIKPMDNASEAIMALKPVTFHYKSDDKATPQFGLIAEEVAKVNPDLVVRDDKGEIFTVRYEAVNAMLLNEFLKEHRKAQIEESKVAELQAAVAKQQKQIEALTAGLQKVTARFEARNSVARVVSDN